jgi:hypothetical protein
MNALEPRFQQMRAKADANWERVIREASKLHAYTLQVQVMLNPAELAAVPIPDGRPPVTIVVEASGRE